MSLEIDDTERYATLNNVKYLENNVLQQESISKIACGEVDTVRLHTFSFSISILIDHTK